MHRDEHAELMVNAIADYILPLPVEATDRGLVRGIAEGHRQRTGRSTFLHMNQALALSEYLTSIGADESHYEVIAGLAMVVSLGIETAAKQYGSADVGALFALAVMSDAREALEALTR